MSAGRPGVLDIGVVSDTHGLVRPELLAALAGVELVLHAGDVGDPGVLDALGALAPVRAVRGNVDRWPGAAALPERLDLLLAGARVLVTHDRAQVGDTDAQVVVFGHSHRPLCELAGGVLWLNPGSAGPRRFRLPVAAARLRLGDGEPRAQLLTLDVPPPRRR